MIVIKDLIELQNYMQSLKNQTVGFTPTMGALHDGHLSLMKKCKAKCDVTVASVFINPKQFGPNEDLDRYPRTLEADLKQCESMGVDMVFVPQADDMYPEGFSFSIVETYYSTQLCGSYRPGYFDGICTVLMKFLNLVPCDYIFMGLKDVEQVYMTERMLQAFNMRTQVVPCETVREGKGLAMSSRNRYLNDDEKEIAGHIFKSLQKIKNAFDSGTKDHDTLIAIGEDYLKQTPDIKVQYLKLLDWQSFRPKKTYDAKSIVAIAAFVGETRLIDNIVLD